MMQHSTVAVFVAWLAAAMPWASARAADTAVDLELVLAVDISRSVDAFGFRLQREGYARAFSHPDLLRAITSGFLRRIAVAYVEWSSGDEQATLVGWTVIDGAESATRFAAALLAAPRLYRDGTSVSGAIDYAIGLFAGNGIEGTRRVIDISGDGPNNWGRPSRAARDDAVAAGFTVNGLAILNDRPSRPPWPEEPVDSHYADQVIGGPGAFMMTVDGFAAFAEGIRKKLVREIARRRIGQDVAVGASNAISLTRNRAGRRHANIVYAGSLDDPSRIEIKSNLWTDSALPWVDLDHAERFPRSPNFFRRHPAT